MTKKISESFMAYEATKACLLGFLSALFIRKVPLETAPPPSNLLMLPMPMHEGVCYPENEDAINYKY
jgi:hypothetical protein